MFRVSKAKLCLAVAALALAIITGSLSAHAQTISQDSIKILQAQIDALQKQLEEVKAAQAAAAAKAAAATPAPAAPAKEAAATPEGRGKFAVGHTEVTVGGFMEAAGIYRNHNETADVGSSFNTLLPFGLTTTGTGTTASKLKNTLNVNSQQSEVRGTARQSRITALAEANANEHTKISAYAEADFLGAAQTANSNESNSYNPRMRVIYGTVDLTNCGIHVLAGQEWSLLTTDKVGIIPRQENIPLTIDAQYVPGFNWTRNPQLRVVQDFDDQKIWLGVSVESPQAILSGITAPSFVSATNSASGGLFNSANSYSTDFAPDVIAKAAFDPGYGHFEAFGITRFFHDYVTTATGAPAGVTVALGSHDAVGFGGGAAAILPICPEKLDFQANFMAGQGIGRYGSCQLPDFAFTPSGDIKLLTGYTAMLGVIGHPEPTWDLYAYGGYEEVERANYVQTVAGVTADNFGYGSFNLLTGQEQTSNVWQITAGVWKRLFQGPWGKVQIGLQDSVTRRDGFSNNESNGGVAQSTYENIIMTSFRYYPL
ncbi:MAG: hypothetical protein ACLQVJ_12120 [Syntrophobacteraceae bacterium]